MKAFAFVIKIARRLNEVDKVMRWDSKVLPEEISLNARKQKIFARE